MTVLPPIPPTFPWQAYQDRDGDGTYAKEGFSPPAGTLTITTTAGSKAVTATFESGIGVRSTTFNWGDGTTSAPGSNIGTHTYAADGTYTVVCSDGTRGGTKAVTVPGTLEDEGKSGDDGAKRKRGK
jgi:hypothetical protein